MKRIVLSIVSVSISLLLWAIPSDTCKIKIEKTGESLDVIAVSNDVYVRKGSKLDLDRDRKNYVFVTSPIVEIICNDSMVIELKGGHQEGKVSCWSQENEKKALQDTDSKHKLAPTTRRNWLVFNRMDVNTQVDMSVVYDNNKEILIDIRKCYNGWIGERMSLYYQISGVNENKISFNNQGDSLTTPPIKLNKDDKLLKFTLSENNQKMVVNKVLIDGDETPFTVYYNKTNPSNIDDIMYDTEIVADSLLNRELPGGSHILSFICTVLTQEGPKDIIAYVPIDVQNEEEFLSSFYKLGLGLLGIIIFIVVLFFVIKRRKPKKICGYDESSSPNISNKSTNIGIKEIKKGSPNGISNEKEKHNGVSTLKESTAEEPNKIMPDEEILNLLKSQFKTDDKNEIIQKLKKQKEPKKEVVSSIINQWNETHPDNVVDKCQMNIESLFRTISNGYIYRTGKSQLEKLFKEYNVEYDLETISATIIRELHDCIYNRGLQDGALSIQRTYNPNNYQIQIQTLSKEKTKLAGDITILTRDKNNLQSAMDKLKQDYTTLEADNAKQVSLVEKQTKKITELESLINIQSQEHVAKLERKISNLNNEIAAAEDTINKKDAEIIAEKKIVESITKKKAELEDKYNKVSTQLNEVEGKHQMEINNLKESHKEAHFKQKTKYEQQIADINAEMTQKQEEHEAKLDKQKSDYEGKLNQQYAEYESSMQQLKDKQAKDISALNVNHQVEIDKLNATIKDLGVSVNVGRDEMIKNADHLLEAISADLAQMEKSVNAVVNQSPIFVNSINFILTEVLRTREEFDEAKAADWSKPDMLQAQVIQDMQDIFISALNRTGWMNNVARLLSYSRLPKLHNGFDLPAELEAHGIYTAILERIYSNMVGLLGIVDMGILVPAVLANDFDKDNYEYQNGDTWIDRFFPEVSMRNYKGKVFDIVQVGYTIDGVTEKKPVVQYN